MPDSRESSSKMCKGTGRQPPPGPCSSHPEPAATPGTKHRRAAWSALSSPQCPLQNTQLCGDVPVHFFQQPDVRAYSAARDPCLLTLWPAHLSEEGPCWAVSAVAGLSSIRAPGSASALCKAECPERHREECVSPTDLASPLFSPSPATGTCPGGTQRGGFRGARSVVLLPSLLRSLLEIPASFPCGHVFPCLLQLPGLHVALVLPESSEWEAVSLTPSLHGSKRGPPDGDGALVQAGEGWCPGRDRASFCKTAKGTQHTVDVLKPLTISFLL